MEKTVGSKSYLDVTVYVQRWVTGVSWLKHTVRIFFRRLLSEGAALIVGRYMWVGLGRYSTYVYLLTNLREGGYECERVERGSQGVYFT
jgi:hypothetical protein